VAGLSTNPWRDLGVVAQFTRIGVGDLAGRSGLSSWLARRKYYSEEYRKAWRDFGQQPGTPLLWATAHRDLRTMEAQTLASLRGFGQSVTLSAGGKSFTLRK
jgi:hypothetical protein